MLIVDAPEVLELEVVQEEVQEVVEQSRPAKGIIYGTCKRCGKRCFTGEGGELLCAEHTFEAIHKEEYESGRRITKEGPAKGLPLL